jgi:hypothetical protein
LDRNAPGGVRYQASARADPSLVKALARAHRWKRLLENGTYASISELAAAEKIDRGYVGTILRLTLLAPDIVEAILDAPGKTRITSAPEATSTGVGLPAAQASFDTQRSVIR